MANDIEQCDLWKVDRVNKCYDKFFANYIYAKERYNDLNLRMSIKYLEKQEKKIHNYITNSINPVLGAKMARYLNETEPTMRQYLLEQYQAMKAKYDRDIEYIRKQTPKKKNVPAYLIKAQVDYEHINNMRKAIHLKYPQTNVFDSLALLPVSE